MAKDKGSGTAEAAPDVEKLREEFAATLEAEKQKVEAQLSALTEQLTELENENTELKEEVRSLRDENELLSSDDEKGMADRIKELEASLEAARKTITKLRSGKAKQLSNHDFR